MKGKEIALTLLAVMIIVAPMAVAFDCDVEADDTSGGLGTPDETSPAYLIIIGVLFVISIVVPFFIKSKENE